MKFLGNFLEISWKFLGNFLEIFLSAHSLRRTGATMYGGIGGTPLEIMRWGSWSSMKTVLEYVERSDYAQKKENRVFSFGEVCFFLKIFDIFVCFVCQGIT